MKKVIYLLLFILPLSACGQKRKRYSEKETASLQIENTKVLNVETKSGITVDLNPFLKKKEFNIVPFIDKINLVTLETTDASLVDQIYKVLVTDSYIYINDTFKGGGLIIFTRNGKFVKRMPHGQGPGELFRFLDFSFSKESNELVLYQHPFLQYYTPQGKYIRQTKMPFGFYNFTVIPNGYVFKTLDRQGNDHLGRLKDYVMYVTDKDFKIKSAGIYQLPSASYGGYSYLYNNNSIMLTHNFSDTIYQYIIENDRLQAKYIMDYSKKKLPDKYTKMTFGNFHNAICKNDYYYTIGEYFETNSKNVFFLRNDYLNLRIIVFRDKKTGNLLGGSGLEYRSDQTPPIGYPISAYNDCLISTFLCDKNTASLLANSSMISSEDKQKLKGLTEDDNPVLVFFKLKDF